MSTDNHDAPPSDDDATRQNDDDEPAKVITAEELAANELAAERAHAERLESDLALLKDILDFHGKALITFSPFGNKREAAILARLGMTPKDSKDPQVRMKRQLRMYKRVNAARTILNNVLHALRTNDHRAWLHIELAYSDFAKQFFEGPEKKITIGTILEVIGEARQELSRRRGFGHLAPGWRDYDTTGQRKKSIPAPTDPESLEHVRTIASQLKDDLISIDRAFAQIEVERVVELLQENTTLERVAGYLVQESSALGYEGKTREQIIKIFETVDDAIKKKRDERNDDTIERIKKRRAAKGTDKKS